MIVRPAHTFLGAPFAAPEDLAVSGASPGVRFAFLGLPLYVRYGDEPPAAPGQPAAAGRHDDGPAGAVRRASSPYALVRDHHDFDLGGPLVPPGAAASFFDCGDMPLGQAHGLADDFGADLVAGSAAVREITAAGAVPLVVGGDHSAPPVVVRGLPDDRPLDVLHVDAHLDFRDEVAGLHDGYSSPIRRLRELPWVTTVVQVGLREVGSARAAGNLLVLAEEVPEHGAALLDQLVARFDPEHRVYITVDVDGLDPSCAPGTLWPAPGGLWFWQLARLVRGVAGRCELAGMDVCEFVPERDPQGLTALAAARLFMIATGASLRRSS